ncbi:hypothetical protein Val02_62760 [Virgisporangium aliadipatigenens]|uniref:Uncharacterized protein n=1 Tax=Virgisporangium aliadipatigenens TaxID=741659 RepID=A0A8J4DSM3_9ACTN|nr:hypothetical protein [Virgisporangium aliadipatigenens]GIJ49390.1 hypothetical protein Val02_62760 [Virgisporangium aliadipatigenens]
MATPGYVGRLNADHTFTARYVHFDATPARLIPVLGGIWHDTFGRDTATFLDVLVRHDWIDLSPNTTAAGARPFPGEQTVDGVGTAAIDPATDPVNAPIGHLDRLDGWVLLIDPATDTVTVHHRDNGTVPAGRHRLA